MRLAKYALAVVLAAPVTWAQAPDAEKLFREGRVAAQKGDYEKACTKFRASQALAATAGTRFNLADCELRLGNLAAALHAYRQLAAELPTSDPRRDFCAEKVSELDPKVPQVSILPSADVVRVVVDGNVVVQPNWAAPLRIDTGDHVIVVSRRTGEVERFVVALREGERKTLELEIIPPAPVETPPPKPAPTYAPAPPKPLSPPPEKYDPTLAYVITGVGAVSLGVSAATGLMVLNRKQTVKDECDLSARTCTQSGLDAADSGKTLSAISTVTAVAGVVGVGAGVTLLVTGNSRAGQREASVSLSARF